MSSVAKMIETIETEMDAHSQPANPDSFRVATNPYPRVTFNLDSYLPVNTKTTLELMIQSGINFNYQRNIMNEFSIGGLTHLFHNQVTFAGLQEGSIYSPSMLSVQGALRYELLTIIFSFSDDAAAFRREAPDDERHEHGADELGERSGWAESGGNRARQDEDTGADGGVDEAGREAAHADRTHEGVVGVRQILTSSNPQILK